MAWYNKDKNNNNDGGVNNEDDIELKPKDVKAKLDLIDGIDANQKKMQESLDKFSGSATVLSEMKTFLDKQKAKEQEEITKKQKENRDKNDTELEEEWLTDPKTAFNKSMQPMVQAQLQTSARLVRKEVFEDPEFEYYHGDIKKEVDELLDKQNLQFQNDSGSIKNAYYTIIGRKAKEIQEGKIKSKFSSTSMANGKSSQTADEDKITLSDVQKKAAAAFGMSEEDYAKQVKELSYV